MNIETIIATETASMFEAILEKKLEQHFQRIVKYMESKEVPQRHTPVYLKKSQLAKRLYCTEKTVDKYRTEVGFPQPINPGHKPLLWLEVQVDKYLNRSF